MKKLSALLFALLLMLSAAFAEESVSVFVTIADDAGMLVMPHEPVTVTDTDADGTLSIADALFCAHAAGHPNGAAAFALEHTQYGLSLTRLWGIENGGSYGYCNNNASAWSLLDPIAAGDHIVAYAFTDLIAWSDTYSFFAAAELTAAVNQPVSLTLSANGYDEAWNPVTLPLTGAALTVNGAAAEAVTDDAGAAVLTFSESGVYVVSAVSDTMTLVPPVCIVTVVAE